MKKITSKIAAISTTVGLLFSCPCAFGIGRNTTDDISTIVVFDGTAMRLGGAPISFDSELDECNSMGCQIIANTKDPKTFARQATSASEISDIKEQIYVDTLAIRRAYASHKMKRTKLENSFHCTRKAAARRRIQQQIDKLDNQYKEEYDGKYNSILSLLKRLPQRERFNTFFDKILIPRMDTPSDPGDAISNGAIRFAHKSGIYNGAIVYGVRPDSKFTAKTLYMILEVNGMIIRAAL